MRSWSIPGCLMVGAMAILCDYFYRDTKLGMPKE